ncbi:putative disease resistance protein RGA1 [Spinacia oleracea]|uniref:Disease resistance protein RGA1 n=1 Tax=Spinacia oleracea TaxID=3562 RepID=A0A9R0I386_SPIOL|nr:putative disease resistance protein RGA1 [Spinacia oleracea]XP_056686761.1 putative disease resistance protein RGA1 [Spinacia oleracea]XP_056686762.1 putative disease resistance protein RGA1 [Spinacia oleracea]XP_056686763.1 putative disease resistance protein RGA1 [Spinacia oleracea]
MAESAVLPLLAEAAKPMIGVLVSRVTAEIQLCRDFNRDLSELQRKIQIISSTVLNMTSATNTRSSSSSSNTMELWVRDVVNIVHNVEDLLDVLAYEKQRQVVMKRTFLWPLKQVYFRRKISRWIKRINTITGEALIEAQTIIQLKDLVHSTSPLPTATNFITNEGAAAAAENRLQQLRRYVDISLIVGRDSDVDSVVDKLCNPSKDCYNTSNNCLSVVAVVGIGGIGKTVLAKKVFEDKRVTTKFTQRIWVVVSENFNLMKILNNMLESVDMNHSVTTSSREVAERKLKENLDGTRYLLVLDDVWNSHQGTWDVLKSSLESIGGSQESMILVTTRDNAVAQTVHAFVHPLPELTEDDSWYLFKEVAFAKISREYISIFETTGKKIVQKCKGVPLAIKTIGGMLEKKLHLHLWEKIERSEIWDLSQDDTGILPSLMLSYKNLSSPFLQKCFSSSAILPKGYCILKDGMIGKWMALGLVQQSENGDLMEDIAQEYIDELLSISFLHEVQRDVLGEIVWYGMHDLVHDLARSVSGHEFLNLQAGNHVTTISDVRHLAIHKHKELKIDCWDKTVVENLRALHVYKGSPGGLLKHVKYLRVLDLCDMGLEEVPESVAGLKCLKSLSLAANPIKVLPEFVTELYNLQSLNLLKCDLLKEVPGGLSNLVNLRHLMIKILNLPAGMIGQLRCLQTLPPLWVNEGGFQISELGDLPHVSGSLAIHGLEHINSKQDAESASLSEKSRVKKLRLLWDSDDDWIKHKEVLDGLKPKSNLRYLIICGYGGEIFPSWLMRMDVIKIIELVGCRRCQKLPTLGHLPFLEKLLIEDMESLECIGEELYCNTAILTEVKSSMVYFPSLKQLRLIGLHKLTEWVEPSSGGWTLFPLLEELKMAYCHELTTTPNTFPSLKQLTVTNITSGRPLSNIITNKSSVKCLKVLQLDWITDITDLPEYLAESCKSLQTLKIGNCVNLSFLPENLSMLISLQVLEIKRCDKLVSIPNLSNLGSLRELMIFHNLALTSVPKGLQSCNSLERLWFACCPKVETLPDLTGLTRLCNLSIRSMTKMITQPPDWLYTLPCLRLLGIGSYWELDEVPDMSFLVKIVSLESLHLFGWEKLQSLPEQLQQFTTLKELGICDCDNMEYLPDWVGNLSSLRYLSPTRCRNLKRLPTMDAMKRLTKLSFLKIEDCPELEEAVQFNGSEYHKISHIEIKIVYPTY